MSTLLRFHTEELQELISSLGDIEAKIEACTPVTRAVTTFILEEAQKWMPSITGRFRGGYHVDPFSSTTMYITNTAVPYASVQEFGGWVAWKSRSGKAVRVPINGNFRSMKGNAIRVKTPMGGEKNEGDSYFVYPAALNNEEAIAKVIDDEVVRIIQEGVG